MKDRLETAARLWTESGRDPQGLLSGTAFFLAQSWIYAIGSYRPENPLFRQEVADYVAASKAALGGEAGWNAMLRERVWCSECFLSFHLENMGMCTECLEYVCPPCKAAHVSKCVGEVVG